jgi:GntR family transcriptional regulator
VRLLDIIIRNSSDQPIYDQIYSQIKNHIISGKLQEGEALPSIRSLAKDLRISVITTKRAYDELERDGFIYTVPAKGCFVAEKNIELIREENLKKIEEYMQKITELAVLCNISNAELLEMLQIIIKENE